MKKRLTKHETLLALKQLNGKSLPFPGYCLTEALLGEGASAYVFEVQSRRNPARRFAMKVLFGSGPSSSAAFREAVNIQKQMCSVSQEVVKVHDSAELYVQLDENLTITDVIRPEEAVLAVPKNYLHLQFLVMEKLQPVLTFDKQRKPCLRPSAIAQCKESEILRLIYDVGHALAVAHRMEIMHRDVKPENIFYDPRKKRYKLGDFGISAITKSGITGDRALTPGYGAPEVFHAHNEAYDCGADIYSLGMTAYVLLNEVNFPGSNREAQYSAGFQLEPPKNGSQDFQNIVLKMCAYDPDNRYQSVDDILNKLHGVFNNRRASYRRAHAPVYRVLGTAFLLASVIGIKLLYAPAFRIDLERGLVMLFSLCLVRFALGLREKQLSDTLEGMLIVASLAVGIYWLIGSGFQWWKLAALFGGCFLPKLMTKIFALIVCVNGADYVSRQLQISSAACQEYAWVVLLLCVLAVLMLMQHSIFAHAGRRESRILVKYNIFWFEISGIFAGMWAITQLPNIKRMLFLVRRFPSAFSFRPMTDAFVWLLLHVDVPKACLTGLIFCIAWALRELILTRRFWSKQ